MNDLRGIIKEKEEESKKGKGRPSKSAKPATKIEKTKELHHQKINLN